MVQTAEWYHRDVNQEAEQGRSADTGEECNCKVITNECKSKLLIKNYSRLVSEEERDDFIHHLDPDNLYILASNEKLDGQYMQLVYCRYSKYFYEKSKRSFNRYYSYCKVFQNFLSSHEKELLFRKIVRHKHAHMIDVALKEIKCLRIFREKLHSVYVAYKLSATL